MTWYLLNSIFVIGGYPVERRLQRCQIMLHSGILCFVVTQLIAWVVTSGWASFGAIAYGIFIAPMAFVWSHELPFVRDGQEPHAPYLNACIVPAGLALALMLLSSEEQWLLVHVTNLFFLVCGSVGLALLIAALIEHANR